MSQPFDLITLGETMLRLVPPGNLRLGQSQSLNLTYGGAESNVAANLARLGRRVSWWSRLPDHPLGHQLAGVLRSHGVHTDEVLFCQGERLGVYFLEMAPAPRGIKVWYDRADSAASRMQPADLPVSWLKRGRWLHLTGITAALSDSCYRTVRHAMEQARAAGCRVSFDVNYRALLWSPEAAGQGLRPLCEQADVVFVARRDAASLFDVTAETVEVVAQKLQSAWGGTVIVTDGGAGAVGCDGAQVAAAAAFPAEVVDRIGAGDAFASGVIDQLLDDAPLAEALRCGSAMAALKLTIPGDIALVTRAELQELLNQDSSELRR